MSRYYVACDLAVGTSRVMLGTLHREQLVVSEIRRFASLPRPEKNSLQWDIAQLYQDCLEGLRVAGSYEEPVDGISCSSWAGDYLLFQPDGSLITPTYHRGDPLAPAGPVAVPGRLTLEEIYQETGVTPRSANTLFQLTAEAPRRFRRAGQLLPVADGFNYLLTGAPRAEMSLAGASQLFNPRTRTWSEPLLKALRLPPRLLPQVVAAGTDLGPVRPDLAGRSGLAEARVVATCSHDLASALAGLPVRPGERWAFLRTGSWSVLGTHLGAPLITERSRDSKFTNEPAYGGGTSFYKLDAGLWILEECQRFWEAEGRPLEAELLSHLAGAAAPFESLINPADPRFLATGDMPLKVQAFCKETNQPIPRKPGPIFRCILESLAFLYRENLNDLEHLTGSRISRLYLLNGSANTLLNHFIANALQVPVVLVPQDATPIGNFIVQALTLGHLKSLEQARELVRNSFKMETIVPQSTAWNLAYDRLLALCAA